MLKERMRGGKGKSILNRRRLEIRREFKNLSLDLRKS
jgi:ribosomal protein L34